VSKRRRRRESLRQEQNLIDRFALSELLNRAPFVEQARRGADDVFADGFEQKMHRFRHAGEFRTDGHDERTRLLDDAPRPPVGVRKAMAHRRLRVDAAPHRLDIFLPGVVVEHKIAEVRMTFEVHAEQILRFPLVPVRRVNPLDDAREDVLRERCAHHHVHPARVAFTVERVAQLPLARAFLDNQAGKAETPILENTTAQIGKHSAGAGHLGR
jgi:hypothetical protein